VDYIYEIMTNPEIAVTGEVALPALAGDKATSPYALPLPHARVGGISGLLELIVEWPQGRAEIADLAERLQLAVDDLLPILDAAVLLGFAEVASGVVQLTEIGQDFANTTILRSKDLFRQQLLARVPVFRSILQTLEEKGSRSMRADFFLDLWDEHFPHAEAERQFATAIDWDAMQSCLSTTPRKNVSICPSQARAPLLKSLSVSTLVPTEAHLALPFSKLHRRAEVWRQFQKVPKSTTLLM